tara:strand:+ start:489 stop:1061 length:573 start_codon:yes stop_codon:yes gene_type:complete
MTATETLADAPCVLDMEASGFGRHSYPVEVGVALPDGRALCTLIRPQPEWTHWDDSAQSLHGISRETALLHGRSARAVAELLNRELAGRTVYTDAWAHDYAWLATLFEAAGLRPAFKLEHVRTLLDEAQTNSFDEALRSVADELRVTRHRASNDARMLQLAVVRLQRGLSASAPGLVPPSGGAAAGAARS